MQRALVLCLLVLGCNTAPSSPAYVIDCSTSSSAAARCDLATFVRACQQASGRNFTWSEATDATLRSTTFDGPSHAQVPAAEFDEWLDATLARHGLAMRPIGPPHLRTYLLEARG